MRLLTYPSAAEFLEAHRAHLERSEVINSLMLGNALRMAQHPEQVINRPYFGAVVHEAEPLLLATMLPPYRLIIAAAQPPPRIALELLARGLAAGGWQLPGVLGESRLAGAFAALWPQITPCAVLAGRTEGVYELREVHSPQGVPGGLRPAATDDIEWVARWAGAFAAEIHNPLSVQEAHGAAARGIENGDAYLWADGGPVSMAFRARPTTHGITINFVYTPPALRGRGYASACVAALSQLLLDRGYAFCTLFTDMANPTSNHIYQAIGYRNIGEFQEYDFK